MTERVDINVPVVLPADLRLGIFANAFRINLLNGDLFLDFVSYSEPEKTAQVVARVQVHPDFLLAMHSRVEQTIRELQPQANSGRTLDLTPDKIN